MENTDTSFVVFSLSGSLYGVRAGSVREMLKLPELTPIEESPFYIPGFFNLRGSIIPVMDLKMRFAHPSNGYSVDDSVIIVEEGPELGIIANEILSVEEISLAAIEGLSPIQKEGGLHRFIEGEAKRGGDIVMLLDLKALIDRRTGPEVNAEGLRAFWPEASQEEKSVLKDRARRLMEPSDGPGKGGMPFAVIALGSESFAIGCESIREFADLKDITPVPCTPAHILGDTNLRGDILTVIDIRGPLGMSPAVPGPGSKVVVAEAGGVRAGVLADSIEEIVYLSPEEIVSTPLSPKPAEEEYMLGAARRNDGVLAVIDLKRMLTKGGLFVDEAV